MELARGMRLRALCFSLRVAVAVVEVEAELFEIGGRELVRQ